MISATLVNTHTDTQLLTSYTISSTSWAEKFIRISLCAIKHQSCENILHCTRQYLCRWLSKFQVEHSLKTLKTIKTYLPSESGIHDNMEQDGFWLWNNRAHCYQTSMPCDNAFSHIYTSVCNAFESLDLRHSFWYAGISSKDTSQVPISRSSGQGQGHRRNEGCLVCSKLFAIWNRRIPAVAELRTQRGIRNKSVEW